ncbi:MAG: hypothetical protein ACRYG4_08850 [Janthinobacterium lividum]
MMKLALVLAVLTAFVPAAASAVQADPVQPAPAAPLAADAAAAAPAKLSGAALDNDPRMLAAIRHANARADQKCGNGAGVGVVDLQTKMAGRTCRRHMVDAAKLDAEFDINGH